jgi:membrane associated rhomboid family serine protease
MYEPIAFATAGIVLITCLFSWRGFQNSAFKANHIFEPKRILADKEFYRVLTSGFLHGDICHLGLNMFSLYLFGQLIELVYGPVQFLTIYFGAIIGGSLLSLFIHRHHEYCAYGASGGVSGVIFGHIFLFPGGSISMFLLPVGIPSWLYAILFLAGTFWALKSKKDNIGHDAHLGGAIIGLASTACIQPHIVSASPKLFATVSAGSLLILLYLVKNPLFLSLTCFTPTRDEPMAHRYGSSRKKFAHSVDVLLDKISAKGLDSLTKEERAFLDGVSEKFRRRESSDKPDSELML